MPIFISGTLKPGGAFSAIDGNSQKLVNVADPTSAQDVATKNYVDTHGSGGGLTVVSTVVTSANVGSTTFTAGNLYKLDPSTSFSFSLPSTPTEGDQLGFAIMGTCDGTHTATINAAGSGITVRDWVAQTDGASTVLNRTGLRLTFQYLANGSLKTWVVQ